MRRYNYQVFLPLLLCYFVKRVFFDNLDDVTNFSSNFALSSCLTKVQSHEHLLPCPKDVFNVIQSSHKLQFPRLLIGG